MPSAPGPEDVEPLSSDESTFQRDEDGNLRPYWRVVEVGDEYRKVQFEPTPIGEVERLEDRFAGKEELETEELTDLMNEKVAEPDHDWQYARPKHYIAVMEALFEELFGEAPSGMAAEVEAELEARQAEAAGN